MPSSGFVDDCNESMLLKVCGLSTYLNLQLISGQVSMFVERLGACCSPVVVAGSVLLACM